VPCQRFGGRGRGILIKSSEYFPGTRYNSKACPETDTNPGPGWFIKEGDVMEHAGDILRDIVIAVVVVGFVLWRLIRPYLICQSVLAGRTGMIGAKYVLFEGVLFTVAGAFFLIQSLGPLSNVTASVVCGAVVLAGIWYISNAVRVFVVKNRGLSCKNLPKGGHVPE